MRLKDVIRKLNISSRCEITITYLCDEYAEGVEALKKEEWYRENKNCKVTDIYVGVSGHDVPEIIIGIDR